MLALGSFLLCSLLDIWSLRPLPCVVFDHYPIIGEAGGWVRGKSSFKFEKMWLKAEGFLDPVRCWWNGYHFV